MLEALCRLADQAKSITYQKLKRFCFFAHANYILLSSHGASRTADCDWWSLFVFCLAYLVSYKCRRGRVFLHINLPTHHPSRKAKREKREPNSAELHSAICTTSPKKPAQQCMTRTKNECPAAFELRPNNSLIHRCSRNLDVSSPPLRYVSILAQDFRR